ncbi:MAG: metal ABC transporter substrate-binding protein [Actinomycetota bacterium]
MARRLVNRRYSASLVAACVLTVAACGDDERSAPVATIDGKPVVVVTYSILGDMVQQLVGDAAAVVVVIPNGQDPHDFSASARDIETMMGAALLVSNGLGLEEGLLEAIHQAADDQVPVFEVADHITVRQFGEGEPTEAGDAAANTDDHANADDHAPDGGDPHLWTSPAVMAEMLPDLAASLEAALGVQLDDSLAAVQADLAALDAATAAIMASIPAGECKLVTGHESLGYFADHYGCRLIGAVIPSLSSTAEASAKELAALEDLAIAEGVAAVFTEIGTPKQVAEQVADTVGVPLVDLPSHNLPETGGYAAYIIDLATRIATALA